MIDFKRELNEAQRAVVTQDDGPCLVLAGAGSGKTRTLVYRVAYLLERGVPAEQILLLTFTNKAAHEMLSRVAELIRDQRKSSGLWGGTFHHVAHRLLRRMGSALDLKKNFTILDREDSKDMLKRLIARATADAEKRLPQPGIFLEVISYAANAQLSIDEALAQKMPEFQQLAGFFREIAERYARSKKSSNALDFDDLLLYWLRLLRKPAILSKLQAFWRYILVDEYQDTNVIQDLIVRMLAARHQNLLVVGDDAQSIYSFRAANIQNILQFPQSFTGTRIFKLEENYRSTPEILDVANQAISYNTGQFTKKLFTGNENFLKPEVIVGRDAAEEAAVIAERVAMLEDEGVPLSKIAVLFRAAHQSQALELELNKRGIPYEMRGGLRFFERAHIKDILAYARIVGNRFDEAALYRVLLLQEGIGGQTANKIVQQLSGQTAAKQIFAATVALQSGARPGWDDLVRIVRSAWELRDETVGALIRSLKKNYAPYARTRFVDHRERLDDIEQLALFADKYDDLVNFLAETSLQEAYALRSGAEQRAERGMVLSTIHQAKGLEWHTVFIMQLTGSSLPHPRALSEQGGLEEERRLFYVAVTRAQRRLYLTYPISSSQFSLTINRPSQFLSEISPHLLTGDLATDDSEVYIEEDADGERTAFLPPISKL